jgi:MATE family multidrug resistance protein
MLSSLFNNVINLIGVAFMGRVGETELAAVGVAALIYISLTMIPYGLSVGFQIIVSRRAGENKEDLIGRVFNSNLVFMVGVGVLLYLLLLFVFPGILGSMFSSQEVYEAGMIYLKYRSFEIVFACLAFTLMAFYTSIGDNRIITWSALVMLFINVFFNYNLVFGKMGFPEMGIAGSGLAALISSTAALVINAVYLWVSPYRKRFGLFQFRKMEWSLVSDGLNLSIPVVLQHLLSMLTWVVFFLLIEKMGAGSLAASNVAKEVYMVLGVTTWGLANATNSLVSNILGQGRSDEMWSLLSKVLTLSIAFSLVFCAAIIGFPDMFTGIFTNDEAVKELARGPVRITGACLFGMAVSSVLFRAVTGTGATRYSLLLELITLVVYMVYVFILIPVLNVSITMAWTSEFLYWLVLGVLCAWYLRSGKWKSARV